MDYANPLMDDLYITAKSASAHRLPTEYYQKMPSSPSPFYLQQLVSLGLICIVAFILIDFPVAKHWITMGLGFYLILIWRYPSIWLLVVPTLLPILDLSPWTGRVFFGEFDLLVLTTCAAGYLRRDPWCHPLKFTRGIWLFVLVLIIWQIYTIINGLLPLQQIDANTITSQYSHYNSLRVAKGFLWALMLLPLLGQALGRNTSVAKLFTAGMLGSLIANLSTLIWERMLFTGLFNFDKPYRVTGLFSSMATGGGPIDAHLVMTVPFIALLFLLWRHYTIHITGSILLSISIYGLAVTFSRTNYLALAMIFVSGLIASIWVRRRAKRPVTTIGKSQLAITFILVLLISFPIVYGHYPQARFASIGTDVNQRIEHWKSASEMMNENWATTLFGMGKGTFPRAYFQSNSVKELPSTIQHINEEGNNFLRFSKSGIGDNLFIRQKFIANEPGTYQLSINLRPRSAKKNRLLIEICERLIFQSYTDCHWLGINTHTNSNEWVNYNKPINIDRPREQHWYGQRPVEIAILNRGLKEALDIDAIAITTPSGKHSITNGGFDAGFDHWFLYSGNHDTWHIDNIWVDRFFEGGWLGLSIFIVLIGTLLFRLIRRLNAADTLAIALISSLVGLLTLGVFNSLFDEPRITLLFYLCCFATLSNATSYNKNSFN